MQSYLLREQHGLLASTMLPEALGKQSKEIYNTRQYNQMCVLPQTWKYHRIQCIFMHKSMVKLSD
jgi:hypothetical protein